MGDTGTGVPPPGDFTGRPPPAPFVPMPPGPVSSTFYMLPVQSFNAHPQTVVQVPLFDTLMDILRVRIFYHYIIS
jgi:hypothetical protein